MNFSQGGVECLDMPCWPEFYAKATPEQRERIFTSSDFIDGLAARAILWDDFWIMPWPDRDKILHEIFGSAPKPDPNKPRDPEELAHDLFEHTHGMDDPEDEFADVDLVLPERIVRNGGPGRIRFDR